MSSRFLSNGARHTSQISLALGLALNLGACGSDKTGGTGSSTETETSSSTQTSTSHGTSGTQTNTSSTGQSGISTGNSSTGHTSSTGATGTTGSTSTSTTGPSGSSGGSGPSGESSDDETTGESSEPAGTSGSDDPGSDSDDSTGASSSSDETSAPSGECTRELLDGLMDDYFAALAAGDPSTLPLAANLKFTENAEESEIGTTAFWMNAGDTKYSQRALDTTQCSVAAQAVIPEGTTDLPVGIRIKVEAGELTEIETIVVRQGDYTASFAVDSNPQAIIDISEDIGWHDEVPEADRASRDELTGWIDKYFRAFPSGVCNVTDDCQRLENGGGNFFCRDGATCSSSTSGNAFEPRVIIVDEVRGITAGFTIFDFQTDGHLDMHMAKMYAGEVHAVHAILRDTDGESGWE